MFIFRWIKTLIFIAIIASITLFVADYKWHDKTIKEYVTDAYKSGLIAEGYKDIKTWIAEIFKVTQRVANEKLTEKDRTALEAVIKNELKENVLKLKAESEKSNEKSEKTMETKSK
jgi:aconitase B